MDSAIQVLGRPQHRDRLARRDIGELVHLGDTVQKLFRIHSDYSRGPGNLLGGDTLLLGPAEIALVFLDLASQQLGCLGVDLLSNELSQRAAAQGRRVPIHAHQRCR